ncbi:PREDICTED: ralA-binding protein 1-like, partial [Chaetura pelagica]|uniref:ralA-binding protein 1-like n=1 Tax=Chaetura pelagica TaxID=8897 RepID=UPI000523D7FE
METPHLEDVDPDSGHPTLLQRQKCELKVIIKSIISATSPLATKGYAGANMFTFTIRKEKSTQSGQKRREEKRREEKRREEKRREEKRRE